MTQQQEIEIVKQLGDQIGYGHLMALASALWRQTLKEKGYPTIGAFVPTCEPFIHKDYKEITETDMKLYDEMIKLCQ